MNVVFDPETIARFRRMTPRQAYETAKETVYRMGSHSSEDFQDVCQSLVDQGILSWEQLEELDG